VRNPATIEGVSAVTLATHNMARAVHSDVDALHAAVEVGRCAEETVKIERPRDKIRQRC
jgi:hypothetical protein